jgi:hypothetical protein
VALAQKYVDVLLPKPRLPCLSRNKPCYFRLEGVGSIIAHSKGELQMFYRLTAESGLQAGDVSALRLSDVELDRLMVNQAV